LPKLTNDWRIEQSDRGVALPLAHDLGAFELIFAGAALLEREIGRDVAAVALGESRHELMVGQFGMLFPPPAFEGDHRVALVVAGDELVVKAHRRGMHGVPVKNADRLSVALEAEQKHLRIDVGGVATALGFGVLLVGVGGAVDAAFRDVTDDHVNRAGLQITVGCDD
jgi:hypothetical protein